MTAGNQEPPGEEGAAGAVGFPAGASPADGNGAEQRIRRLLEEHGVEAEVIDRAVVEGNLHLLVVDTLVLPAPSVYTPVEVAERSGMPIDVIERFWRALGFPNTPRDDPSFGPADIEALSTLQGLLGFGLAEMEASLQLARVIGSAMARVAEAEITASPVLRGGQDPVAMAELFALTADATLPGMARLLEYSWRRHLQAAARRAMLLTGVVDGGGGRVDMAVGFADLVGFTVLSQQLTEPELVELVSTFERVAHETVTVLGGRVVKMIGDEAMYVAQTPDAAAEIALGLSEAYSDDDIPSDVRIGVANGEVVARDGDYYGPVVNMASRIVNIAAPGSVLVSDEVHRALEHRPDYHWRSLRPRYLKDIGRVPLWRLRRTGGGDPDADRPTVFGLPRAGMRLGPERLLERVERLLPGAERDP